MAGTYASSFTPQLLQQVAKKTDIEEKVTPLVVGKALVNWPGGTGTEIKRKPSNEGKKSVLGGAQASLEQIESGVPGLRQKVPLSASNLPVKNAEVERELNRIGIRPGFSLTTLTEPKNKYDEPGAKINLATILQKQRGDMVRQAIVDTAKEVMASSGYKKQSRDPKMQKVMMTDALREARSDAEADFKDRVEQVRREGKRVTR